MKSGKKRSIGWIDDSVQLEGAALDVAKSDDCREMPSDGAQDPVRLDEAALDAVRSCVADAAAKCPQMNFSFDIFQDDDLKSQVRQALDEDGRNRHQQTKYITDAPCVVVIVQKDSVGASKAKNVSGQLMTALHKRQLCTLATSPSGAESRIRGLLSRPVEQEVHCVMPIFAGDDTIVSM